MSGHGKTERESSYEAQPGGPAQERAPERKARPNIVLLISDQHTIGHVGAYGHPDVKTPNMDSLAASGVSFMKSYCASPQCAPARASIHTGRMPHVTRVNHNKCKNDMDWSLPNFGDAARSAGYTTAWCGKLHLGGDKPGDTKTPTPAGMEAPPRFTRAYYPTAKDGIPGFDNLNYSGVMKEYAERATQAHSHRVGLDVDPPAVKEAIQFIERPHDRPFLLVVSILNPHDICMWPMRPKWLALDPLPTDPSELPPLPANHEPPEGEASTLVDARNALDSGWLAISTEERWRQYLHVYGQFVEHCDDSVGSILAALRERCLEEETVVIYTSDHGDAAAAHKLRGKHVPYEEAVAVPFIIRWKGNLPEGVVDETHLVSGIDIFSTVCDFAGAEVPAGVGGSSIREVIDDPSRPGRDMVAIEIGRHPRPQGTAPRADCRIVRTPRYKYMRFETAEEMLFDMDDDPGEMSNLAGRPEHSDTLLELRRLLEDHLTDTNDPFVMG